MSSSPATNETALQASVLTTMRAFATALEERYPSPATAFHDTAEQARLVFDSAEEYAKYEYAVSLMGMFHGGMGSINDLAAYAPEADRRREACVNAIQKLVGHYYARLFAQGWYPRPRSP
ncbi:hypothetical protein DRW03_20465 [Corallococcus sp. H22C18031201]|uniref:hypothetical protein n=1 Tax=Citreicoccus inhibens TaxID=2849499 RepID=UPI000E75FEC1|nr:hypothetical protein [Citreicoccus inhibens]MBU8895708.1 hypothetical protein [Citreicoccus inhibens]RJS20132.1 hypothetical protein DRW03_20465 [Corallococcus sp. H22C18031201]